MTDDWYSEDAATFGDRLCAAREAAGLKQEELAKQIGVKTTTLTAWENDWKEPRANRLQMLTGMLGVSLVWLLTGEGDGPEIDDSAPVSADLNGLLAEMRTLRGQMQDAATRMGQLEKRLRTAIKAQ